LTNYIRKYQVRGIPGYVNRISFDQTIVDYWSPVGGSDHLLLAHDGQNIFDRKTATFIYTWKLAQNAIRVAEEEGKKAPLIIGVFHSSSPVDPHGRGKDLTPEDAFREGVKAAMPTQLNVEQLHGNKYLEKIFNVIAPALIGETRSSVTPETSAMIGSSMGGLATLYSAIRFKEKFHTALALSPHWPLGGEPLVDWMINKLPNQDHFRIWMSRGTKGLDASYKPFQDRADALMRKLGWDESSFRSKVYHRTAHNERSWASYVNEPLRFWLSN
jgi:predicted alpha/beta superfamily hydrolase